MSQYGRVSTAVWDDDVFINASDLGRTVWLELLTGPQITALPGLQRIGVASLAETLRRPVEAVAEELRYFEAHGRLAVDSARRVVWVKNAPKHNPAESPNHIKAWWTRWREIPDCPAKFAHVALLRPFAQLERGSHAAAWTATFGTVEASVGSPSEALPKGSASSPEGLRESLTSPPEDLPNTASAPAPAPASAPTAAAATRAGARGVDSVDVPEPEADPVTQILAALRAHQATLPLADEEMAQELAAQAATAGVGTAEAIRAIGEWSVKNGPKVRMNGYRSKGEMASSLAGFIRQMAKRAQVAAGAAIATDATARVLAWWTEIYPKSRRGYGPYVVTSGDEQEAAKLADLLARHAHPEADRRGFAAAREDVERELFEFWAKKYLADDGENHCCANARHPLRLLEKRTSTYGLPPWNRPKRAPKPAPTEPEPERVPMPAEVAALAKSLGLSVAAPQPRTQETGP